MESGTTRVIFPASKKLSTQDAKIPGFPAIPDDPEEITKFLIRDAIYILTSNVIVMNPFEIKGDIVSFRTQVHLTIAMLAKELLQGCCYTDDTIKWLKLAEKHIGGRLI